DQAGVLVGGLPPRTTDRLHLLLDPRPRRADGLPGSCRYRLGSGRGAADAGQVRHDTRCLRRRFAIRADERRPAVVHPCPRRAGPPRRGLHLRPQRRDDEPAPHWPQCTGANAARQLPHTFDRADGAPVCSPGRDRPTSVRPPRIPLGAHVGGGGRDAGLQRPSAGAVVVGLIDETHLRPLARSLPRAASFVQHRSDGVGARHRRPGVSGQDIHALGAARDLGTRQREGAVKGHPHAACAGHRCTAARADVADPALHRTDPKWRLTVDASELSEVSNLLSYLLVIVALFISAASTLKLMVRLYRVQASLLTLIVVLTALEPGRT